MISRSVVEQKKQQTNSCKKGQPDRISWRVKPDNNKNVFCTSWIINSAFIVSPKSRLFLFFVSWWASRKRDTCIELEILIPIAICKMRVEEWRVWLMVNKIYLNSTFACSVLLLLMMNDGRSFLRSTSLAYGNEIKIHVWNIIIVVLIRNQMNRLAMVYPCSKILSVTVCCQSKAPQFYTFPPWLW